MRKREYCLKLVREISKGVAIIASAITALLAIIYHGGR